MKKVSRTISLLLLCAMMLTIGFSFGASADVEKNEWRGIKWEYDTLIDAVTIHCTGVAPVSKDMPWKDRAADITAFVFDSGVTEIPAGFSDGCVNMDAIKIPATTRVIGEGVLTVGNLTDVWYEGNWESFTQIKMSDEDFAAALKAKFHGSRIVIGEDGSVQYVEEVNGEAGNDLPIPGPDPDNTTYYRGEYDPITGKELDYSYPSHINGKNCTVYSMKDGSYSYVFDDAIILGKSGQNTDEGTITDNGDGSKTVGLKNLSDSSERSVFIEKLGDNTISTTTKADKSRTFLLLDEDDKPDVVISDADTTVSLVGDNYPRGDNLLREEIVGDKANIIYQKADGTDRTYTVNKDHSIEYDANYDIAKITENRADGTKEKVTDYNADNTTVTDYNAQEKKTKETVTRTDGTVTVTDFDGTAAEKKTKETVTVPGGNVTETLYNSDEHKTQETVTEPTGTVTVTDFDGTAAEKKTKETVTRTDGTKTVTDYNADNTTVTDYDAQGKKTKETVTIPNVSVTESTYDANGTKRTETVVTSDKTESREYDANGTLRKEVVINSDDSKSETLFDANGNKTVKTEKRSDGTTSKLTEYDASGDEHIVTEYAEDGTTPTQKTEYNVPGTLHADVLLTKVTTYVGGNEIVNYYYNGQEYYSNGSPVV